MSRQTAGAGENLASFFRDLLTLIELQGLLFLADAQDEFRKARHGLLLMLVCAGIGASSLPIGLAGVSLVLAEETRLTVGQALLCVAAAGLLLAGVGGWLGIRSIKPGPDCLGRSRAEWRCNVNWLVETLKNRGDTQEDFRSKSGVKS
jgi:hypothetical protein